MTRRAILWCGYVKSPVPPRAVPTEHGEDFPDCDPAASINDLEIAFAGARELGVPRHEIHACVCDPALLPRRLETPWRPSTVAELRRLTGEMARRAAPEDVLLFVATNHGEDRTPHDEKGPDERPSDDEERPDKRCLRGLTAHTDIEDIDDTDERAPVETLLTPATLAECLDPLPGAQILVVAACYAGCFLDMGAQGRRVVLSSCGADEKYWVKRGESSYSAFIAELFAVWCGVALWDHLAPENLPLDEAFERTRVRLAEAGARTIPLRAGSLREPILRK